MSQGGIQQFWLHKRKDIKKSKIVKIIKNKIVICFPMEYLEVLKNSFKSVCAFRLNWHLEVLVFKENTRVPEKKPFRARKKINNKLNPQTRIWTPPILVWGECSHHCTTHAPHKKRERKWLKVSSFDVIVDKRASSSKKLCKYMQYCGESPWKCHAGVDSFFCFVEFPYKGQLANGITFCRMDQLLGDPLCWELCYLIKKFLFSEISLKKASFSPNNIILKKKKQKYYEC